MLKVLTIAGLILFAVAPAAAGDFISFEEDFESSTPVRGSGFFLVREEGG